MQNLHFTITYGFDKKEKSKMTDLIQTSFLEKILLKSDCFLKPVESMSVLHGEEGTYQMLLRSGTKQNKGKRQKRYKRICKSISDWLCAGNASPV